MRYTKENPRLTVQFIDADTEQILFQVNDRTWMNVGDILTAHAVDAIMKNEYDGKFPENLMVLVVSEYQYK